MALGITGNTLDLHRRVEERLRQRREYWDAHPEEWQAIERELAPIRARARRIAQHTRMVMLRDRCTWQPTRSRAPRRPRHRTRARARSSGRQADDDAHDLARLDESWRGPGGRVSPTPLQLWERQVVDAVLSAAVATDDSYRALLDVLERWLARELERLVLGEVLRATRPPSGEER